jgi:hypothetical protein
MLQTDNIQELGQGLWYLPQVFDQETYRTIKKCYRETVTGWQCLYPNRLMSLPNNPHYETLADIAKAITPQVSDITGYNLKPINQEIFVDLPGHQLTWHFDHDNYRVLLQIYTGDLPQPRMGTQWYLGPRNQELFAEHGADGVIKPTGLEITETPYAPNAGYINDNTQKKCHGTRVVPAGIVRESVLFTFL